MRSRFGKAAPLAFSGHPATALIASVALAASLAACSRPHVSTVSVTVLTQAAAGSRAPLLPNVVVNVAKNELLLEASQAALLRELASAVDVATRDVERARIVYLEVLARDVERGAIEPSRAVASAERLARAAERAAPALRAALQELHAALSDEQRRELVARVKRRWSWMRARWADDAIEAERAWLEAFVEPDFATAHGSDVEARLGMTARGWAERVRGEVEAELLRLDPTSRHGLASRLRADDLHR